MPVSPFKRDVQKGLTGRQPDGSSVAGSGAGRRGKRRAKPTSSRRNRKQKIKEIYAKAREDAQLAGIIPTTPEGAVRNECVDPRLQGCQQLPALIRQALREDWSTPAAAKPGIIGALLEPFFVQDVVLDKDGNQVTVPTSRVMLIELARTLKLLDQTQWERDHPEEAGRAKGGSTAVAVSVQTNNEAINLLNEMLKDGRLNIDQINGVYTKADGIHTELAITPPVAGSVGDSGFKRAVETSAAPDGHKQGAGEGVAGAK